MTEQEIIDDYATRSFFKDLPGGLLFVAFEAAAIYGIFIAAKQLFF